ncbi:MAG: hypothetical protein AAFY98_08060, partial [Verrucomicrobiota bacterium]
RNILSEALSTLVPLLEDSRTVLALCDYKASGKSDEKAMQKITGEDRNSFMELEIPKKLDLLKEKYEVDSELREHVLNLMAVTKALVMNEGILNKEIAQGDALTLKIRSITLSQPPFTPQAGGQPALDLTRKTTDTTRNLKAGELIVLSDAEIIGALVTIAGFLANILEGVQQYAQEVGATDDKKEN